MTLRGRIAAVAGGAVAVAIIAVAVVVYVAVRSELRGEVEDSLSSRAQFFTRRAGEGGPPLGGAEGAGDARRRGPGPRPVPPPPGRPLSTGPRPPFGGASGYVQLIGPTGMVFRPPGDTSPLPVEPRAKALAESGSGRYFTDMRARGIHLRVLTVGLGPRGAVQVARPLDEVDHALSRLLLVLVLAVAGGIAVAALLGGAVARAALAPIRRFTSRTETLSAGLDLSQRIEVAGRDELARLAQSFNTTLDALERAVEAQRHLVADASHELRTPIASLRANIQVLEEAERLSSDERERMRADIIEELDELTALVGDVVELARGAGPDGSLDDVRLDQVVRALVERARRREGGRVEFRLRLEPTVVRGEPDRISRAVSNVLENACKWSPSGGCVEVELAEGTLTIRDHGPGFHEDDLPHVFERFYRAKEARGMVGSGLGLAIVRQAAEAHGGSVEAANAKDGGAVIRLRFGSPLEIRETAVGTADPSAS